MHSNSPTIQDRVRLDGLIAGIPDLDMARSEAIWRDIHDLAHPPGSLGRLEETMFRLLLMAGEQPPRLGRKVIFTFGADHGVWEEDVSTQPQSVTVDMVHAMCSGRAAVNALADNVGAENRIVDVGVAEDFPVGFPNLIQRKVRRGTANMASGPAMSESEAVEAMLVGADLAMVEIDDGATLLGTGEMGICNTTASSAIFAALLPCPVEAVTGRGSGINNRKLAHKVEVIKRALKVNAPRMGSPLGVLASVGGLEIAAIAGMILGSASRRTPVVVDGFISSAGALVALRMCPQVSGFLFYSHRSAEAGHSVFLDHFGHRPLLDLDLRLGEGTGAALAMSVVEGALKCFLRMARFSEGKVGNCEIQPDE